MKLSNIKLAPQLLIGLFIAAIVGLSFAPAAAASTAVAQGDSGYTCAWYTVKRGDTLTRIAIRYHTTVRAIMNANHMSSTRIYTGHKLCIPVWNSTPVTGPWAVSYWNNTDQSGSPALVRTESAVNNNWGYGTPDPVRVFSDNFSARYSRSFTFVGGTYRFMLSADDGIRLWVDGAVVFDQYGYVGGQSYQVDVAVNAGVHSVRVDYVERSGLAYVRASFYRLTGTAPAPCPGACPPPGTNGPWSAQYFNNMNLSGAPVYMANYGGVAFNWGMGSPHANVPVDNFSARYTQYRYFPAGVYRFVARSDDGVRIFVDDKPVVNQWVQQSARTVTGDISLNAGSHLIRVEYFDLSAFAELKVYWEFLGNPTP
jgi:hypothetical protein